MQAVFCAKGNAPPPILAFRAIHTFVVENPQGFDLMATIPLDLNFQCESKAKHDELSNAPASHAVEGIAGTPLV
ncbi:hypothetical protein IQ250_29015 [Pseudanabaenaceae cyanobacterium LEGE 13415]|nr:hypothetical protein [Pseudanabaenaceae cyanobacterium LEGE 13415]